MSGETSFIDLLRGIATDPAARGLRDDAAVFDIAGRNLVLTKDMLVEGVHYLPDDPPADVAWKLVAVNLSDLAAKGAQPVAALLGYMLGDAAWDRAFAAGLRTVLDAFGLPLIGGDTVSGPNGPRVLSLTALGTADGPVPDRAGAKPGDDLWVSGTIGDAATGLAILRGTLAGADSLVRRYRTPQPRLDAGRRLARHVSAMMDVSDGLLIDAARLGDASGAGIALDLDTVPLSPAFIAALGDGPEARLRAATGGDDYELLFTAPQGSRHRITGIAGETGLPLTRIGTCAPGAGLSLSDRNGPVPLPDKLGWEHEYR